MKRLIWLFCFPILLNAETTEALFLRANNHYNQSEFTQAIEIYQELVKRDTSNGTLHFNLANAYFKQHELGRAIFHYLQAKAQLPRDADVEFNLKYARNQRIDKVEHPPHWVDYLGLSFGESILILLLMSLVFWSIWWLMRLGFMRNLLFLKYGLLLCYLLAFLPPLYYQFLAPTIGVVTAQEVSVYSGVGRDQVALFSLHQGAEVTVNKVMGQENNNTAAADSSNNVWAQIQLDAKTKGWINVQALVYF